mgnify:CR=1 FL=1
MFYIKITADDKMFLLEWDKSGRVSGTDTGATVTNCFVCH